MTRWLREAPEAEINWEISQPRKRKEGVPKSYTFWDTLFFANQRYARDTYELSVVLMISLSPWLMKKGT